MARKLYIALGLGSSWWHAYVCEPWRMGDPEAKLRAFRVKDCAYTSDALLAADGHITTDILAAFRQPSSLSRHSVEDTLMRVLNGQEHEILGFCGIRDIIWTLTMTDLTIWDATS